MSSKGPFKRLKKLLDRLRKSLGREPLLQDLRKALTGGR